MPYTLNPQSKGYRDLVSLVKGYVKAGQGAISSRKDKWNEAENNRKAYINLKAVDKNRLKDADKGNAGYPGVAPIVVPITYAMNMTTLSYFMSIFASRNPVIPIIGGNDDTDAARKMEAVLTYQCSNMRYILKLYLWLQDMLDYGVGVSYNYWKVKTVNYVQDANTMGISGVINRWMQTMGGSGLPTKKILVKGIGYEGNDCDIVDPYNLLIDPRYSLTDIERGDFFGFSYTSSMDELLVASNRGEIQNYASLQGKQSSKLGSNSRRDTDMGVSRSTTVGGKGTVDIHKLFIKLVPSEYELEPSTELQLIEVRCTDDGTLIYADKVSNVNEEIPCSVMEYNPDGHSLFNLGQSELLMGLQQHLSWLFNSHMDNVRKSLNDMLIVDPSRINMKDLTDPKPGKLIRLNETALGQDVRGIVHQLQIGDVTGGHLNKASVVIDFMQRISAASDNMMGMPNFGRRTATEIDNIQVMAGGRMKMLAELAHAMAIKPQHGQFISNTQQYMSQERAYRILGENGDFSKVAMVAPGDILGQMDVPPADGTIPTDRMALAQTWKEIFNMIVSSPAAPVLTQIFNPVGIFENIASLMGAKDLTRFVNQQNPMGPPQVAPDEQVQREVQAGNMVPMQQALGPDMDQFVNSLMEGRQ